MSNGNKPLDHSIFSQHDFTHSAPSEANMIGISSEFIQLQARLKQVAKSNIPVLLTGETGTGKEIAAKFIHTHSNNSSHNFVVVDCTLLTESLFESELFGHERGAFTSAVCARKGLFEIANNGSLFLDEVGELPLSQQPKLLRALETGQFRRIGGTKTLISNVRIICATHWHLGEMVKQGKFREDLYYRLSVICLDIEPLRNRKEDIPLLVEYLLKNEGYNHFLTPAALNKLMSHSWPGNIRELKNCLQGAVALSSNKQIDEQAIHILRRGSRTSLNDAVNIIKQSTIIVKSEREILSDLITKYKGNRKLIASELGVSERTLYRRLIQHGLKRVSGNHC